MEGIGDDFVPELLKEKKDLEIKWEKIHDEESFIMARRLIAEEGILCGKVALYLTIIKAFLENDNVKYVGRAI